MGQTKILIVEDDADINNLLAKILRKEGYEPIQAYSGTEGWLRLDNGGVAEYSLLLLDLMLPGMMGEELIRSIRKSSQVPILVLSAKSALQDRVEVLNLGADDYLTKPFEKEEVIARVNSALRRYLQFGSGSSQETAPDSNRDSGAEDGKNTNEQGEGGAESHTDEVLRYKNIMLNIPGREARICKPDGTENPLVLTAHEFDILALLMQNPNKVFSRESLYEQIWQGGYYGEDNTVNVHVSNLRKKIAVLDPEEEYIKTVWGIGFKMETLNFL